MATQYGGTIRWVFEADDTQFNQTVDNVSSKAKELREIVNSADNSLNNSVSDLAKNTKSSGSSISNFFSTLGNSLKGVSFGALTVGATTATGALSSLASKGIQATDFLETARTSMAGLTGSFEAGNAALSKAAQFWQNNPFDRFTTTKATQQLIQFGRQVSDLSSDLELLGNVSLSTNTPLDELARFYARTSASGRAMTQDIEMMSDRGIPIYRELAKQLKTTEAGVREFASKGKIDFETFRKALEGAVDAEAMESFENTLARQKDRLSGSISILAGDLAGYKIINNQLVISEEGLEKAWTRLLKTVATALRSDELRNGMAKLGDVLASVIDKITPVIEKAIFSIAKVVNFIGEHTEVLTPIIGGLLLVFGNLAGRLPVIGQLFNTLTGNIGGLTKAFISLGKAHPILATLVAVFGAGLVSAIKNSEDFRNAISRLVQSFAKIAESVVPVFQSLIQLFANIVSSDVVVGIITSLAQVIAGLAEAIASLPVEVIEALTFAILSLIVATKTNPFTLFVLGITMAIASISEFVKSADILSEVPKNIAAFFDSLPQTMVSIGENVIAGFVNGLDTSRKWVWESVANIASGVITTFQSMLGIHSPSTVMAEQGKYVALGLANGITNNKSVVQKAMSNLAKATLTAAQKAIQNRIDFNVIDYAGQYQAWKQVAQLFVEGSDEYASAIENMEEARKQANLQIISLQESYNDALDESIDKVKNFYGLFSEVDTTGGKNSTTILKNLDKQVASLQEYMSAQATIAGLNLDEGLIEELQSMGIDSINELQAIAQMTSSELEDLNNLWLKKQEIANSTATILMSDLKDSTLDQISEIKSGIDGETVEVSESGARLISSLSDGILDAMPTLQSAYAQLGDYMKQAAQQLSSSSSSSSASYDTSAIADSLVPSTSTADEIKSQIEESMGNLGTTLGIGAAVALGTAVVLKFAPKVLEFFRGGSAMSKLANSTSEAVSQGVGTATNAISSSTSSIAQTGQTMSKFDKVLGKIAKIAGVVILCALALASVAAALWVLNNAIPNDSIGALALKVLIVGEVITVMGGLGYVIGKFGWAEVALGLVAVAGVAVDLLLLAEGLAKLNQAIPNDSIGAMSLKILEVGEVIAIIGGLSFAAGILSGAILAGVVAVIGIAEELIKVSEALDAVNQNIPDDFDAVRRKVENMVDILKYITGESFGDFFANLKTEWDLKPLRNIMEMFAEVSGYVQSIAEVNFNPSEINSRVDALTTVIQHVAGENIPGGGLFQSIARFFGGNSIDEGTIRNANNVLRAMRETAEVVSGFPTLNVNEEALDKTVETTKNIVNKLSGIQAVSNMEAKGITVDHARNLIDRMKEFIWSCNQITGENGFLNIENTNATIDSSKIILTKLNGIVADGKMEDRGIAVDHARNLLDRLKEFIASANALGDTTSTKESVENAIATMNSVVSKVSTSVSQNLDTFTSLGSQMVQHVIDGISSKQGDVGNAGNQVILSFTERAKGNLGTVKDLGRRIVAELIGGVESKYGDVSNNGKDVANKLNDGIRQIDLSASGRNAVQGFVNGLTSYNAIVRNAGRTLANTFLDAFRRQAGEGSPWKSTYKSGQFAGEGLIEGLVSMEDDIADEAELLAESVSNAFSSSDYVISPSMVSSGLAPAMDLNNGDSMGSNARVVINQDITNYTPYDVDAVSRDLSWELSKV